MSLNGTFRPPQAARETCVGIPRVQRRHRPYNVTYIDSSCLSILMAMYQERVIKKHFAAAHLAAPPYAVRRLFQITGFDALWPVHERIEDAMKAAQAEDTSL